MTSSSTATLITTSICHSSNATMSAPTKNTFTRTTSVTVTIPTTATSTVTDATLTTITTIWIILLIKKNRFLKYKILGFKVLF